ncbi:DUF488 domain-containing protein [Streptomyces sp. NPDC016845]|uniref:DUF488 domain-containing protein n=1 Tax=Streptomyces sp. NPDC016845 TaxID=3364972 RepID=UPI0037ACFCBD
MTAHPDSAPFPARRVHDPAALRSWYHEDREGRFETFAERYEAELAEPVRADLVDHVRALARRGRVTLVTAVKEIEHSHVPVLARHLGASGDGS